MPRATECLGGRLGVGKCSDCCAAVFSANAGCATFELVDSYGKGCSEYRGILLYLVWQFEFAATRQCDRGTQHASCILEHEIYLLGSYFLRCDYKVAFVLAIFVVDDYHHFALAEIVDSILYVVKFYHCCICFSLGSGDAACYSIFFIRASVVAIILSRRPGVGLNGY